MCQCDRLLMYRTTPRPGHAGSKAFSRRLTLAVALMVLLVAIAPGPATNMILDQVAGPYEITVGASPVPLKVGQGHLSVLVQKHSNALVVTDAQVTVTITSLESNGTSLTRQATHELAADKRQYGVPLTFETPGRWTITMHVEGPDGSATTHFNVTVQRDFPARLVMYLGLISIPLGGALLIVYWLHSGGESIESDRRSYEGKGEL